MSALTRLVPLGLKLSLPAYRQGWLRRHTVLTRHIAEVAANLRFGETDGTPWIEEPNGQRFHGFWTEGKDADLFRILAPAMPKNLAAPWFRIARDYVTRYRFPHMWPDLRPDGARDELGGFHGQHKDSYEDLLPETRQALLAAFRPGPCDVVLDGGCYVGFGAVRMAREAPEGKVYAVEADARCHALLCRNLSALPAGNALPIHAGLWRESGRMALGTGIAQANSLIADMVSLDDGAEINVTTVDRILEDNGVDRLDMLSLTINGAEVEALAGARRALEHHRPRIRLAGWYRRNGERIADTARNVLEEADYWVYTSAHGDVLALPREHAAIHHADRISHG
ncbi:MAG: FkbM family methyltransferase [Rhodospirillaceae bacterium]|jgi:FkbM family methyltransferase|nr:FkbM family methyltransferase [Rhodospirillaceae bacterium]